MRIMAKKETNKVRSQTTNNAGDNLQETYMNMLNKTEDDLEENVQSMLDLERVRGYISYRDLPEIYEKLSQPLPPEAMQQALKGATKLPYDMTGYNTQYLVNRMNEVLFGHWRVNNFGVEANDKEVVAEVQIEIGNWRYESGVSVFEVLVSSPKISGGVRRYGLLPDNIKGAMGNAIKKALSYLGVGKQAYEGVLDEDYAEFVRSGEGEGQQAKSTTIAKTHQQVQTKIQAAKTAVRQSPVGQAVTTATVQSLKEETGRALWNYLKGKFPEGVTIQWWNSNGVANKLRDSIASVLTAEGDGQVVKTDNIDGLTKVKEFISNRPDDIDICMNQISLLNDNGELVTLIT